MASYSYDPYGNTLSATGTQAADNPWRFAGGYYDNEGDGLYHFGERYYDRAGHWTQQDRLAGDITQPGSVNRYLYAGANPVNLTDPFGRDITDVGLYFGSAFSFIGGAELLSASFEAFGAVDFALGTAVGALGLFSGGLLLLGGIAAIGFGIYLYSTA